MNSGMFIKKKRVLFTKIFALLIGAMLLFSGSRWEDIRLYSTILFTAGVIMVGIATMGRVWCNLYICGYKSGKLITEGPYSMCRNPLYFFSLIGGIGIGLVTMSLTHTGT